MSLGGTVVTPTSMTHFHHATPVIGISDVNAGAVRLADDATNELSDLVLESGHTKVYHWELKCFLPRLNSTMNVRSCKTHK